MAGFAGFIDDAILTFAGVELRSKKGTLNLEPVHQCMMNVAAKLENEARAALKDVFMAGLIAQQME